MTSAFAMLFALMPGMAGEVAAPMGEAKAKGDGDAKKDGSTAEDDGKDLPSDAILLPSMPPVPFALPPVVTDTPTDATATLRASTDSPAPIASLLAAMPAMPPADAAARGGVERARPSASLVTATTELPPVSAETFGEVPAMRTDTGATVSSPMSAPPSRAEPAQPGDGVATSPMLTTPLPDVAERPDSATQTMPGAPIALPLSPSRMADGIVVPAGMEAVAATPLPSSIRAAARSASPGAAVAIDTVPLTQADIAAPSALPKIDTATPPPLDAPTPLVSAAATPNARHGDGHALPLPDASPRATNVAPASTTPQVARSGDMPAPIAIDMPMPARATVSVEQNPPWPVLRPDLPARFSSAATPVATPLPVTAPAIAIQPGQTAPAMQLFAGLMRAGQQDEADPLQDRTMVASPATIDAASLGATPVLAPVAASAGPDRAPLDMTQAHWPQTMIERIDRMREDAATADSRIQLSPDALGGIAVAIRREDGATHIHFTAEQAQTATLLAEARPTLAQLAEDKGMRLGQTAVDLGQSGGGERQAPQRQPEPVIPARPAFAGTPSGTETGEQPAGATTRIA